ncbi:MAG TPA: isoprenylcysteine carboxylmethyltransferase family protein [Anaerolineales bacterium]|nr:isoprenylcysteine carboxylmethyltransferase family protein [Anaerolineales bacterium]
MTKPKAHAGFRIPAPTLTLIHITIAILLGRFAPLPIPAPAFVQMLGLGFAAFGFVLGILALFEFRRVRTAPTSKKPTIRLVTSGIYRYTRNPIYLGFVLMLVGLPLSMGTYWGVILIWPLVTVTNNLIINHEETYLKKEFTDQYVDYSSRVRRWL